MRNAGLTAVELVVSIVLSAVAIIILFKGFSTINQLSRNITSHSQNEVSLAGAYQQIMEVGRLSDSCQKLSGVLTCKLNMNIPAVTGSATTDVRFLLTGTNLTFESLNGVTWNVRSTYKDVLSFTVCDDADMDAGAGGTCAIAPTVINTEHTADLNAPDDPTQPNKFFRFQIVQRTSPQDTTNSALPTSSIVLNGAFFVRGQIDVVGAARFQWGFSK